MKYHILYIGLVICCLSAYAQKTRHPLLLYTAEKLAIAKQRIHTDSAYKRGWLSIRQTADKQLTQNNINELDYLSLTYLMTGEKRYANKIKENLLHIVKAETFSSPEMLARKPVWRADLGIAHKAYLTAIAFDAVYNDLTPSERKQIAKGLERLFLRPCMEDWLLEPTRIHSLNSMGHNWWASCVAMGGILALSLQNEIEPAAEWAKNVYEALPQWFQFTGDVLQHKPKNFADNGGMYESVGYASFGVQEALQFWVAWKHLHPRQKMTEIPQLRQLENYFINVCYPRTGILYSLNFGDSHRDAAGEGSLELLHELGLTTRNSLWYIKQVRQNQRREGFFLNTPMGLLYTPDLKDAPQVPSLKPSCLFSDFGWATMRTSWKPDATLLAAKSGFTWNHSHADANSFIVFHKGVDIIKDGGNCWYPRPEYREYFFQSEAHNVVMFNGKGQPTEQQYHGSPISGRMYDLLDEGDIKYVLADGTGPRADQFSRNFRHFLWIDNVIYVIDDLKSHEPGNYEWLWHTNGTVKKSGPDLNVVNGQSAVTIRPLYPRLLALSDFVHDYPNDLYIEKKEGPTEELKGKETYYSFHLPGKRERVKGVTAIILKDNPEQTELPQMERREGKDWLGLRITYKGTITDLYINQLADGRLMHSNSWFEADGWYTDAYMFAVRYKQNSKPETARTLFICYGSTLRKDNKSYFSSLYKQTFIRKR